MTKSSVITYFLNIYQILNKQLEKPAKALQSKICFDTNDLPALLKIPLIFCSISAFVFYIIFIFANNLIYNLIGIVCPLIYGASIANETDIDKIKTYNKYWIIFGVITLIDSLCGFFLHLVPYYYYLKIGFIYILMRNNFSSVDTIYDRFARICTQFASYPLIKKSVSILPFRKIDQEESKIDHQKLMDTHGQVTGQSIPDSIDQQKSIDHGENNNKFEGLISGSH